MLTPPTFQLPPTKAAAAAAAAAALALGKAPGLPRGILQHSPVGLRPVMVGVDRAGRAVSSWAHGALMVAGPGSAPAMELPVKVEGDAGTRRWTGMGPLEKPMGLAVDGDGRLLVVESGRHRVLALDPDGMVDEGGTGR
jgi:hypothetical protein